MSDVEREEAEIPHPVGVSQVEGEPSIVDLLKSDLSEVASHKEVYIRVPGYDKSGIQLKYRMPENTRELAIIAQTVERTEKDRIDRNILTIMDTIIRLCDGVYCQPGTDEPVPLDPNEDGIPCQFDYDLANALGMDTNNGNIGARQILKRLFHDNEFAIINHGEKLNRWLVDQNADVSQEFWQLGE